MACRKLEGGGPNLRDESLNAEVQVKLSQIVPQACIGFFYQAHSEQK